MKKMNDDGIQEQIKKSLASIKEKKATENSKDVQLAAYKIKSDRDDKKIQSLIVALKTAEESKEKSYFATVVLGTITGAFLLASIGIYANKDPSKTIEVKDTVQKVGKKIQAGV